MPFGRREIGEADRRKANEHRDRILALARAGVSPVEISRIIRIRISAVEELLESAPPERPSGADASPGPALPGPSGLPGLTGGGEGASYTSSIPGSPTAVPYGGVFTPPSTDSLLYEILMEAAVPLPLGRGIVRRARHFPPDDIARLESILSDSGLSPATRRMVLSAYREELSIPAPPPKAEASDRERSESVESPAAKARRAVMEGLELRALEAQVLKAEREARGEADGGGELSQLRAQVASLTAALREKEILEQMSRHFGPLAERVKELEGRLASSRKTKEDVSLEALGDSMRVVTDRLKSAPQVLQKFDKLGDLILDTPILETAVHRRTQQVLSNVTGEPIPPPPVPPGDLEARYGAAAAEMDRLMEQDSRPRYHIPGSAPIKEE